MSAFFEVIGGAEGLAQGAAGSLIAGLWESALLVAAVALVLKMVPQITAAVRFAIWTAVFCVSAAMSIAVGLLAGGSEATAGAEEHLVFGHMHLDPRWSYLIAGAWLLASAARMTQLLIQAWRLRSLWMQAVPVADETLAGVGCEDLLARRRVRVCTSEDVDRPSVIGFFAPKILLPAWLFAQLSSTELRHIVLHEMEHLRRRDDWMNLLQKIGLVVFPLNPALFWVDRRLAAEREMACDDGVLRRIHAPRSYAASLASIAERRLERKMHRRVLALALGVLGRSEFSRRIESILGSRSTVHPIVAGTLAAVLVVGVLGFGRELMRVPLLVSFAPVRAVNSLPGLHGRSTGSGDLVTAARLQEARFRSSGSSGSASLPVRAKSVPPQLKPRVKSGVYGTAEEVPSGNTNRFGSGTDAFLTGRVSRKGNSPTEQWVVLTSFGEDAGQGAPAARLVVKMGDGRFYEVPYAAVPVRDGWLIVQL